MDNEWITNHGQVHSVLPALGRAAYGVHPGDPAGGRGGEDRQQDRENTHTSAESALLNKAQLPA